MILALEEDGVLYVYESPERIVNSIEALDIEGTLENAFDEDARPYSIEWIRPNRTGNAPGFLKFLGWAENGEYRLVVSGPSNPKALIAAIDSALAIDPKSAEDAVRELRAKLESRIQESS